jgi:hypothetical protein
MRRLFLCSRFLLPIPGDKKPRSTGWKQWRRRIDAEVGGQKPCRSGLQASIPLSLRKGKGFFSSGVFLLTNTRRILILKSMKNALLHIGTTTPTMPPCDG